MYITNLPRDLLQLKDLSTSSLEGRSHYLVDTASAISPQGRQQLEIWMNFRDMLGGKITSRKDLEESVYHLKVSIGDSVYFKSYCEEFTEWSKENPKEQ